MATNKDKRKLTPHEQAQHNLEMALVNLAHAHNYYYHNLVKYGPNLFEDDGSIYLRAKDRTRNNHPGRELILDTIKYFEGRDHSYFYMKCARLKKILDAYDKRFPNAKKLVRV